METNKIIEAFLVVGDSLSKWSTGGDKALFHPIVQERFYDKMLANIELAGIHNKWFTKEAVNESFLNFGNILTKNNLGAWVNTYVLVKEPKDVGLILAGNIPLVGFHDILSTIFSGNRAMIRLSRDDKFLLPLLLEIAAAIYPEIKNHYEIVEKLNRIEAVIATGSDNTSLYFEKYFGHLPRIIRKNRTSVAVLSGNETTEELRLLGKDIFAYFGLGCRNVSHLILPKGYDLNKFFGAIVDYGDVINHNKYGNNYDYYRAIFLMNQEPILENGFLLTRETKDLFAPVAVLHYHFYESKEEVDVYLSEHEQKIQVIVGHGYTPFGQTQSPGLCDYADNVDTMEFLTHL
ncbi:MAG: acyl-CoA reductase [Brumimicrobium sp.]|nr:acyl-CoA reductase [Brumimicrobium sp.]